MREPYLKKMFCVSMKTPSVVVRVTEAVVLVEVSEAAPQPASTSPPS
jgi:hypothetical protein